MPKASSLEEKIKNEFGFEVELIESKGGIFDVHADGQLVFSKHTVDRFPEEGEVEAELTKLAANR